MSTISYLSLDLQDCDVQLELAIAHQHKGYTKYHLGIHYLACSEPQAGLPVCSPVIPSGCCPGCTFSCSLCAGVQWQARAGRRSLADQGQITEVDIFKDGSFASFRSVLDSVLKDLHKQGIGTTTKRADCISEDTVGEAVGGGMYFKLTHRLS